MHPSSPPASASTHRRAAYAAALILSLVLAHPTRTVAQDRGDWAASAGPSWLFFSGSGRSLSPTPMASIRVDRYLTFERSVMVQFYYGQESARTETSVDVEFAETQFFGGLIGLSSVLVDRNATGRVGIEIGLSAGWAQRRDHFDREHPEFYTPPFTTRIRGVVAAGSVRGLVELTQRILLHVDASGLLGMRSAAFSEGSEMWSPGAVLAAGITYHL